MDEGNPTQLRELEIVFYTPPQPNRLPAPVGPRRSGIPTWEKLTDRLDQPTCTQRLEAKDCLKLFPTPRDGTVLETVTNLASGLSPDREERNISGFLLLSLCAALDVSGRVAPEEIDKVIKVLTMSTKPKYLDKLKRGARMANEAIAAWAEREDGDRLVHRLDRATQTVLQGRYTVPANEAIPTHSLTTYMYPSARFSVSQWSVLAEYCTPAKERIVSRALPRIAMGDGPPLAIPLLVSYLIKGFLPYVGSPTPKATY